MINNESFSAFNVSALSPEYLVKYRWWVTQSEVGPGILYVYQVPGGLNALCPCPHFELWDKNYIHISALKYYCDTRLFLSLILE
jgi:hypothetical protein